MKTRLSTLLAVSALALFPATAQAQVNLRYAIWDQTQVPSFEKIISAFEAENPDITVDIEVTPGSRYWTKLQTEAGNGNMPDVFWLNPFNFPLYASEGIVVPVDDYAAASGFDVDAIPQAMRDIYTYDGKLYSLPNNRDAIVVWYNKALLKDAGVEEPAADWTWADFQEKAKALTNPDKEVWGTATALNLREDWVNTVHQAGGAIISEDQKTALWDTPEAKQGLKFWSDMASAGWSPDVRQLADSDAYSMFLSGRVAMIYAGSWMGITFADSELASAGNLGVAVLPKGPANNAASTSSLGNMISVTGEHQDEAYKFVEFLGSKTAADIYTQGGIALSAYPEFDQNFIDFFAGKFDAAPIAAQIANVFSIPRSFNSPVWMGELNGLVAPIFLGEVSLDDGLANINAMMQSALDQEPQQ